MTDYLKIVYDEAIRPYTSYPQKLVNYLFNSFQMKKEMITFGTRLWQGRTPSFI